MKDSHLAVLEQNEFGYEEETCINENFGLSDFCCKYRNAKVRYQSFFTGK